MENECRNSFHLHLRYFQMVAVPVKAQQVLDIAASTAFWCPQHMQLACRAVMAERLMYLYASKLARLMVILSVHTVSAAA